MRNLLNSKNTLFALLILLFSLSSCTAGNIQFAQEAPAGFWWGIWHGMISFISLIIHLFDQSVLVYEVNNTGGWYDFGFLLGVLFVWGSGSKVTCKFKKKSQAEKEWEEIGDKVEKKVMRKMKEWAEDDDGTGPDAEWDEIGEKVEKKLKRKIREWAEKE